MFGSSTEQTVRTATIQEVMLLTEAPAAAVAKALPRAKVSRAPKHWRPLEWNKATPPDHLYPTHLRSRQSLRGDGGGRALRLKNILPLI